MSWQAHRLVLSHSRAKGSARLVLDAIAYYHDDGGAWPSRATLARDTNLDESNVRRALAKLRELGELVVHVQAGGPAWSPDYARPNLYLITIACPPTCDRTPHHRDRRGEERSALPPGASASRPPGASASRPPGASASQIVNRTVSKNDYPPASSPERAREAARPPPSGPRFFPDPHP